MESLGHIRNRQGMSLVGLVAGLPGVFYCGSTKRSPLRLYMYYRSTQYIEEKRQERELLTFRHSMMVTITVLLDDARCDETPCGDVLQTLNAVSLSTSCEPGGEPRTNPE